MAAPTSATTPDDAPEPGGVSQSSPAQDSPAQNPPAPRTVLDDTDISRALTRITHEILERNRDAEGLVILGIPTRGVPLAHRVAARMSEVEARTIIAGALDITMYRDDLRSGPVRNLEHTDLPDDVDGKTVVLVDDVLMSGRTIRAGLDALADLGRPKAVQLAVLVDRGHRELPIRADFVGKNLPTSLNEKVRVRLSEIDDQPDSVSIVGGAAEAGAS
ncbi:bifunctional pyr operon transcriptional regulator/uracil phosphoribosyltransferase PyrR [Aeromicrobium sp. CTD01-1L150]|uniref:bifunctional pyr operon transcriptional regulator/uracil phosphoribosyltransferase PyrR n=1 Tax=Aeromicrobium sp. CTD01-1L150 TaxID=3341830 RepID=UPI0035C12B0D